LKKIKLKIEKGKTEKKSYRIILMERENVDRAGSSLSFTSKTLSSIQ
jgi:hypothetical protein